MMGGLGKVDIMFLVKKIDRSLPDFSFEAKLWASGYKAIAGVDEVGRGAFAGPVVAGAVVFGESVVERGQRVLSLDSPSAIPPGNNTGAPSLGLPVFAPPVAINDSKQMSITDREVVSCWIKENCLSWGVGEASVNLINRLGIVKATRIAMRRAIGECNRKIDFLLIDAFYIPYICGLQKKYQLPIIKGDERSLTIASASIIAKVHRDSLMNKLSLKYPNYYWNSNKGYGTREHQKAIQSYGLTPLHRKKFIASWRSKLMTKRSLLRN